MLALILIIIRILTTPPPEKVIPIWDDYCAYETDSESLDEIVGLEPSVFEDDDFSFDELSLDDLQKIQKSYTKI